MVETSTLDTLREAALLPPATSPGFIPLCYFIFCYLMFSFHL